MRRRDAAPQQRRSVSQSTAGSSAILSVPGRRRLRRSCHRAYVVRLAGVRVCRRACMRHSFILVDLKCGTYMHLLRHSCRNLHLLLLFGPQRGAASLRQHESLGVIFFLCLTREADDNSC